jgi:Domain of unknown function (DUF4178)
MASPLVAPPVAHSKALACPNCGGPIEFRSFGHAINVTCPQCLSILDASDPQLQILQRASEKMDRRKPVIPLGSRGTLRGVAYEVIGFQARYVQVDGETYEWQELLLFNPYKGFRYLTFYQGHWNLIQTLEPMPRANGVTALFEGQNYKHFTGAVATTAFVLGEFPWRVRAGEKVRTDDYICPPNVLSSETTNDEVTWSKGEYVSGDEIWKAFQLPDAPPRPVGIYLNQPSPFAGKVGGIWTQFVMMELALVVLMMVFAFTSKREVVLNESHRFSTADTGEPSFVTKPFELKGRAAPLALTVNTDLANDSVYLNFALINDSTGQAVDFSKEIGFYAGSDEDGSWKEGSKKETIRLPAVEPGSYYLRVEPEMDAEGGAAKSVNYELVLMHDSPSYSWFLIAGLLLLLPPVIYSIRAKSYETQRWMESDRA